MPEKMITVKMFRFNPDVDQEPYYKDYRVPLEPGMSVMDALDYIYRNLDGTIAYYDHAGCTLGICYRCNGKINGKTGLFCQTTLTGDITLEPAVKAKVVRDLVYKRGT